MPGARRSCRRFVALAAIVLAGCGQTSSTNSTKSATPSPSDAAASRDRAIKITEQMLAVYRQAESYADRATYIEESVYRGEGVTHELPYYQMTVALVRPNRLRLTFSEAVADAAGRRQGFDVASDGEYLRAAVAEIPDQLVEKPAPAAFTSANVLPDPLIRERLLNRPLAEVFPQLAMLVNTSDEDDAAVFPDDSYPRLLADEELNGRTCHRVATSHPEGTRVLWIDRDTSALHRVELPVEAHRRRIDPDGNFLRFAVRIDFEDVTFNAEFAEEMFTLAPTPGAHRVRRFVLPEEELTAKDAKNAKEENEEVKEMESEEAGVQQ